MPGWSVTGGGRSTARLRVRQDGVPGLDQVVVSGSFGSLYLSPLEAAQLAEDLRSALVAPEPHQIRSDWELNPRPDSESESR